MEGKGSSYATPSGKSVLSRGNRKYGGPDLEGAWPVLGMVKESEGLEHREGGGVIQKQALRRVLHHDEEECGFHVQ